MIGHVLASGDPGTTVDAIATLLIVLFAIVCYFIPTIVAAIRQVPNTGSVVVINLFLGWTFMGWVVALAMAMRSR
jgi:T4 superinfection immunity protein